MVSGNVVVTGANRGIGFNLVKQLVSVPEVQLIFATCRSPNGTTELRALAEQNPKIQVLKLDISSQESINEVVKSIQDNVGDKGLNVLINNAGILLQAPTLEELTPEQMKENFAVNTVAPFLLTRALIPLLETASQKSGKKAIVANISSELGSLTLIPSMHLGVIARLGNALPYHCSKVALNMVTRCLATEKPNLIVVSIHPGWVITDMGGADAALTGEHSSSSIVKTLQGLKEENSGCFYNWAGEVMPW